MKLLDFDLENKFINFFIEGRGCCVGFVKDFSSYHSQPKRAFLVFNPL